MALEAYEGQWCTPVRLEVPRGAKPEERRRLGNHFATIPYRTCSEADWNHGISLARKLRDRGRTVPWFDVLIASFAIRDGIRSFAIEEHFHAIRTITGLQLYEPGYGGLFKPE